MASKIKKTVVIGLLGTTLDAAHGSKADRWSAWRPTIALGQNEDLLLHRFELLYPPKWLQLAQTIVEDLRSVSPETEVRLHAAQIDDPWDFAQVYGSLFDFARAYPFDTENEDYLIHITTGTHVAQICLFLLTEAHWLPGRLLQGEPPRRGEDGEGRYRIIDLDLSRYDAIASRFKQTEKEGVSFLKSGIATRNAAFNRLMERIEAVAVRSREPILIMGATGAGKSHLARRIYALKKARQMLAGNFVEVNSATLRGDQAMSALFGHVKGAFTGAAQDRPGLLRKADSGVLFLDEIGDLGADEQAMLLRAVEDKRFLPVGADAEVNSDFQLIAGTNCDLWTEVQVGRFREDLLARINLWTFRLPGLRERPEDIEPNLDYELEQHARLSGAHLTFSKEARLRFLDFAVSSEAVWTANFRDLNGAVRRLATLAKGGRVSETLVGEEIQRLRETWRPKPASESAAELDNVLGTEAAAKLDRFERVQLADVIAVCRQANTISEAGRTLFANSRQKRSQTNDADRLRKYLNRFGLSWRDIHPQTHANAE